MGLRKETDLTFGCVAVQGGIGSLLGFVVVGSEHLNLWVCYRKC